MNEKTKIVCVTQSYDDIGNIDTETYDLLKMGADNPYRMAVEKAIENRRGVARLEMPQECWELDHPVSKELKAAEVRLPVFVVAHVHVRTE